MKNSGIGSTWLYIAAATWAATTGVTAAVAVVTDGWSRLVFVVVFCGLGSLILAIIGAACHVSAAIEELRQPGGHVETEMSGLTRDSIRPGTMPGGVR